MVHWTGGRRYRCPRTPPRCYIKQDLPQNWLKPIPLQVLRHIYSIAKVLGDPLLMAERNMIIIAYFFSLCPGEYMFSKSERTKFYLKSTAFSCGCRVFAATSFAGDLQASNFTTINFRTQKSSARKKGHKASGDSLLCLKLDLLHQVIHLRVHGVPPFTPLACVMTPSGR